MNPRQSHKITLADRFHYAVDDFMARGGVAVFLSLLTTFLLAFFLMALLRVASDLLWHDPTTRGVFDHMWRTLLQILDTGNVGLDSDAPLLAKAVGLTTTLVGMVLFSTMVAFVTTRFQARLEKMRKGHSRVIESGHCVLIGFGDRIFDILRELIIANESKRSEAIVILADQDKQQMDEVLRRRIPHRKTTKIITRSGAPFHIASLETVGVERARSVTILSESRRGDDPEVVAMEDARVLQAVMAVVAALGDNPAPPIVAELHLQRNRDLAESIAPGRVTSLDDVSMLARMLVQTSRIPGLALVYSDLVGFEGNELYFFRPADGWTEKHFGNLAFHFARTIPLGIRTADGELLLNPPADTVLGDDDQLVVLAEDDSLIRFERSAVCNVPDVAIPSQRIDSRPERHLVIGWTAKTPIMIREYARYVAPGSEVHVLTDLADEQLEASDLRNQDNVTVRVLHGDPTCEKTLERVRPEEYDDVVILASDGLPPAQADAATVSNLLRFRHYFGRVEQRTGSCVQTRLLTEVMDSENIALVLRVGINDFLISNRFLSKILAQVAEEPEVARIYDELFSEWGNEIYLKPARLYFGELPTAVRFADCVAAAQQRGEVCLGYERVDEHDPLKRVKLIPRKTEVVELDDNDRLVVLARGEG